MGRVTSRGHPVKAKYCTCRNTTFHPTIDQKRSQDTFTPFLRELMIRSTEDTLHFSLMTSDMATRLPFFYFASYFRRYAPFFGPRVREKRAMTAPEVDTFGRSSQHSHWCVRTDRVQDCSGIVVRSPKEHAVALYTSYS